MKKSLIYIFFLLLLANSSFAQKPPMDSVKHCKPHFIPHFYSNYPLHVYFENNSVSPSNYFLSSWNFGDSTSSTERSPVHKYNVPGLYHVCLTISDPQNNCVKTFCDSVKVPQNYNTLFCNSEFIFFRDTAYTAGIKIKFLNLSKITNLTAEQDVLYKWDFGDGTGSSEKNPIHIFPEPDFYNISLNVRVTAKADTNKTFCVSNSSRNDVLIGKPRFCNLGGQVFEGQFPISFGKAEIYKSKANRTVVPVAFMNFDTLGYYYFYQLIEGNYFLKILPPDQKYFPTYFGNTVFWKNSSKINLRKNIFNSDVHLVPIKIDKGKGQITGTVTLGDTLHRVFERIEIILTDKDLNPLTYTWTDFKGIFRFDDIPSGKYMLYAERVGWYGIFHPVTVTESATTQNINIEVKTSVTSGIEDIGIYESNAEIALYPNPVTDICYIRTSGIKLKNISVFDFTGKLIKNIDITGISTEPVSIDMFAYPKGIYFISISSPKSSSFKKLIKL